MVSGVADPDLIDQAYTEHNIFSCLEKQSFERGTFLEIVHQIASQTSIPKNITQRETEVLTLVAQGLSNKEIATNLFEAAWAEHRPVTLVSRSDSTLRGHYPGEVNALVGVLAEEVLITIDGVCIIPFFPEGGRWRVFRRMIG